MLMHVNAKKVAFLGVSMALSIVLVVLSGIIEMNTLFLLALASFFTGIAIGEFGLGAGASYMAGSVILSLILAPNKLYVFTYAGICFYLVATEFIWRKVLKGTYSKKNNRILMVCKAIIFNIMYIPLVIFVPKLLITRDMSTVMFILLLIGGQVVLIAYDYAYHYFMNRYWLKLRRILIN
ncbi:MAG: hypothetical protein Q4F05_01295 [bacterium]|nr:hypothetical protein [bacterium]